ncbi:MAG: BACON domain-containing protein [Prevotella sp.]
MKLKYFVPMFIMAIAMLTSCSDDEVVTYPGDIRVSSSYMALPVEGGSASIDVFCNQKWEVDTVGAFPKKEPWFDYSVSYSDKGQVLTITADETLDGRSTTIKLVTEGGTTQYINVMQGLSTVSTATCAEVIAGPDSKTYRVKGVCTGIANTTYGNWYLNDGTGEIYIYGTLDKNGATKNFLSLGIEVGDEITVEGPKLTYGSTVELVDVTVVAINKSLIKVDSTYVGEVASNELPLEGGELTAYVTCKGNGVTVDIPEDAKDWLSIAAIKNGGSEVIFKAAPNNGGDRSTTVIFKTTDGKKDYTSQMTILQKGAIVPVTCAEFNAKPVGDAQYRIIGLVTNVANTKYGNIYVQDYTGEVYVYGTTNYSDFPVKEGDVVNIVGPHAEYKGNPQMANATIDELCASAEPISLAGFNAAADDNDKLYVLTGKITEIANDKYGNVYIEDENGEKVYLYGVYGDWTGENKQYFLNDNGIAVGDTITVVTIKTSYKDAPQGKNAVCFGVKKAE